MLVTVVSQIGVGALDEIGQLVPSIPAFSGLVEQNRVVAANEPAVPERRRERPFATLSQVMDRSLKS